MFPVPANRNSPLSPVPASIIWHGNRHSRGLQGTSARAMASICVHRALQTPPGIAPGHISSRDDLQEEPQPATHSRQCPIPRFPANHLARQSPFYVPAGNIGSRDGIDLCPSSTANPFRHRSKAHSLARWFARSSLYKVSQPDIHGCQRPDTGFLAILQSPVPHVLFRHVSPHSSVPIRFADSERDIKYLIHRASDYVSELRGMAFGSLG